MKRNAHLAVATAVLLCSGAQAFASNYATCILDKAPGAVNDIAAQAVHQVCLKENPGAIQAVPQGSGRGLMGYNSGAECVVAKAKDTRSNQAAAMIGVACRKLYDDADWWKKNATPLN
ncbi:MAG: hypothetical protein LBJ15_18210 [Comamonas sp.]|uniref:hypothetical protein n=1 Tax=Comamonas sp. TaxID=34028 RepID=UPI002839BD68|nr:hypothetical protein [Comamonas sp.]MDR0215911.1 hypothetical protein [Comamonas sp.]